MTRLSWWRRRNGQAGQNDAKSRKHAGRPWLERLEARVTPSTLIPVANRVDLVYDSTRGILDITAGGTLQQFSIASQQLLAPVNVGFQLHGADITPDGSALYATEAATGLTTGVLHKVNLST